MGIDLILLVIGLGMLVIASDMLIEASVRLAEKFHISKLAISLTVVALGTSVPETVVSILSAIKGSSIAFANVVGSNLANTALIIGVSLMIGNIFITKNMKNESLKLTLVTGIFLILCFVFKELNVITGIFMLIILAIYVFSLYKISKNDQELEDSDEGEEWIYRLGKRILRKEGLIIFVFIVVGILGLVFGGDIVVDSATNIATFLHINEGMIGASIIAIGTSLPELITAVLAMKKKQYDIVMGNVIGSNIINILLILGISGILTKIPIAQFEIIQLALLALITIVFLILTKMRQRLDKKEGILLLILYMISIGMIYVVK